MFKDVEEVLEYFDTYELDYSNDDIEAIVKKLDDIRRARRNMELVRAIEDVECALKHFFELGGYISYNGEDCDTFWTWDEVTDDMTFSY